MFERLISWTVPLAALALYAYLGLDLGPQLVVAAGGGTPFDLRLTGYSLAEARAYLAQLTPEGLALYLGPVRIADTFLPLLTMVTLMLPLRGKGQFWFLPALVYGLADLGENITVAQILRDGFSPAQVVMASTLTQVKFIALGLAVGLGLWSLWRIWRQR